MPPDLERLAAYARQRGFKQRVAVAIFLIGCLPALIVILLRPPAGGGELLVGALLAFTPAALLLLWTVRDRRGQDAREIVMWLRVVDRAVSSAPWAIPYKELPDVAPDDELDRVSLRDLAVDLRETIGPLVAGGGLNVRIGVQRFWYPVQALIVGLFAAVIVVVVLSGLPRPA